MRCASVQDRLVLYLAGELSPRESGKIIEHTARCADCTALAEQLAVMQERLESVLKTEIEAPSSLDARVMAAVRDIQERKSTFGASRTLFRRPTVYAASLCCVVLIAVAITVSRHNAANASLSLASLGDAHNRLTASDSPDQFQKTDPAQLAVQLTSTVNFPVRVSDLNLEGAQLVGGNQITVTSTSMAELHYRYQGKQISLFEMDSSNQTPAALKQLGHEPDAYYAHKSGDMAYVAWHSGKTECVMVSREVPMHLLFHLACKACERQEVKVASL
jgi:anti-sigma factor RsiW